MPPITLDYNNWLKSKQKLDAIALKAKVKAKQPETKQEVERVEQRIQAVTKTLLALEEALETGADDEQTQRLFADFGKHMAACQKQLQESLSHLQGAPWEYLAPLVKEGLVSLDQAARNVEKARAKYVAVQLAAEEEQRLRHTQAMKQHKDQQAEEQRKQQAAKAREQEEKAIFAEVLAQPLAAFWKKHKRDFEAATGKKKPGSERVWGFLWTKASGIEPALEKIDKAATRLDPKDWYEGYKKFKKSSVEYAAKLEEASKDKAQDEAYRQAARNLKTGLDKLMLVAGSKAVRIYMLLQWDKEHKK